MPSARGETAERPGRSRFLHALLLATVGLPALAFFWGMREGRVAFVVYRESKLAALEALVPLLLAALAWGRPPAVRAADALARLRRPTWALFALFLLWGLTTVLWVVVPENLVHELGQYALLLALALALDAWAERDPRVIQGVERGLVGSLGLAAAIGIVQAVVPIPILAPIDPAAAANPSVFGYKNPMALALAGQLFLLARCLARARPGRRLPWAFLLAAEIAYLAALNSRTAWGAVAGGALLLGLFLLARAPRQQPARRLAPAAAAAGLGVLLFGLAVAADPNLQSRAASLSGYLAHPSSLLASDRGIYLQNTLQMVRFHPPGVGLGDWQTQYPLYRRVHRDLFTDSYQVRMAHGDFVQILGETGWPGLALWLGVCALVVAIPAARCLRTGDPEAGFAAAQAAVLVLAQLSDGLLQHPYGKLQFVLVAWLALRAGEPGTPPLLPAAMPADPAWRTGLRRTLAALLAAAGVFLAGCRVAQAYLAAHALDLYQEATDRLVHQAPPRLATADRALLAQVARAGERLLALPGHSRERCDDLLILAHAELLLGRREQALIHLRRALRLHPYNPAALSLMATAFTGRPVKAGLWQRAHDQVLAATHGFEGHYPGRLR